MYCSRDYNFPSRHMSCFAPFLFDSYSYIMYILMFFMCIPSCMTFCVSFVVKCHGRSGMLFMTSVFMFIPAIFFHFICDTFFLIASTLCIVQNVFCVLYVSCVGGYLVECTTLTRIGLSHHFLRLYPVVCGLLLHLLLLQSNSDGFFLVNVEYLILHILCYYIGFYSWFAFA